MTLTELLLSAIILALIIVIILLYEGNVKKDIQYTKTKDELLQSKQQLIAKLFDLGHQHNIAIEKLKKEYPEYDKACIRSVRKVESNLE